MKKYWIFIIFILFFQTISAELIFTEIMYNLEGPDAGREWIELFNVKNQINMSQWKLRENNVNHFLKLEKGSYILNENDFVIIVQDIDSYLNQYNYSGNIFSASFLLNNGGEELQILDKNLSFVAGVNYSLNVDEGYSIERISIEDKNWTKGAKNGIPGKLYKKIFYDILHNDRAVISIPFNLITINKNLKNEQILNFSFNISQIINNNLTLIFENSSLIRIDTKIDTAKYVFNESNKYFICAEILSNIENKSSCSWTTVDFANCNSSLDIIVDKNIYENKEKIEYTFLSRNFDNLTYWIEDVFGNKVRSKKTTTNANKKSFTPNIDEKEKSFVIKSVLSKKYCNNMKSQELVTVRGSANNQDLATKIKIISLTPATIAFGEVFKARIQIVKGDTQKSSIKAYVTNKTTKVSEITSLNMYKTNQEIELTIPIKLNQNCNNTSEKYDLIVEGLNAKDAMRINVSKNSQCMQQQTLLKERKKLYELLFYNISDTNIIALIKLNNPDVKKHNYSVWSYLYNGKLSYPADKKANIATVNIDRGSHQFLILINNFINISDSNYSFKINILRDDRKTPYEITETIFVKSTIKNITKEVFETNGTAKNISKLSSVQSIESGANLESQKITGKVIYESSGVKTKKLSKYLVFLTLIIAGIAFYKLR